MTLPDWIQVCAICMLISGKILYGGLMVPWIEDCVRCMLKSGKDTYGRMSIAWQIQVCVRCIFISGVRTHMVALYVGRSVIQAKVRWMLLCGKDILWKLWMPMFGWIMLVSDVCSYKVRNMMVGISADAWLDAGLCKMYAHSMYRQIQ